MKKFNCWRRIMRIPFTAHVRNATVRERFHHEEPIEHLLRKRRLRWLGHTMRMQDNRLPKATLMADGLPGWKRPQGGPRKTWRRTVQTEDLRNFELNFSQKDWKTNWRMRCETSAQNRSVWRQTIADNISGERHWRPRTRGGN